MNFKIGQELLCVSRWWRDCDGEIWGCGPKYREVVTVEGFSLDKGLYLVGYTARDSNGFRESYDEVNFRPAVGPSAIQELINKETVKETSDFSIQIPA